MRSYIWSAVYVGIGTACFWLLNHFLGNGQAPLLYLPIVIICAIRYGYGVAIWASILSFLCWNFFFIPPYYTFMVHYQKDWVTLIVFLISAILTSQIAAKARWQAFQSQMREAELSTILNASNTVTHEISTASILDKLSQQLCMLCDSSRCFIYRRTDDGVLQLIDNIGLGTKLIRQELLQLTQQFAEAAAETDIVIGFEESKALWIKAVVQNERMSKIMDESGLGVYVPMHAANELVGVLHLGPRIDLTPFSSIQERLILTLANHAAIVLARERLMHDAAQATALREADTLKETLLSLVSHELRTPLAAIKASVTGLLQPDSVWESKEREEALQGINIEVDRLTDIVSDLLDLSRLEAGAWNPNKDWCDLSDIVGSVLDRLPANDAARVEVCITDQLPLIQADYVQIALLLTNLLENAIKYSPSNKQIMLEISSYHNGLEELPAGVLIRVRDYGAGIPAGEEERIFERFYRSKKHKDQHGTGIGLALCKAIAIAHMGRIWAANASNKQPSGAIFSVELPVNEQTGR